MQRLICTATMDTGRRHCKETIYHSIKKPSFFFFFQEIQILTLKVSAVECGGDFDLNENDFTGENIIESLKNLQQKS